MNLRFLHFSVFLFLIPLTFIASEDSFYEQDQSHYSTKVTKFFHDQEIYENSLEIQENSKKQFSDSIKSESASIDHKLDETISAKFRYLNEQKKQRVEAQREAQLKELRKQLIKQQQSNIQLKQQNNHEPQLFSWWTCILCRITQSQVSDPRNGYVEK